MVNLATKLRLVTVCRHLQAPGMFAWDLHTQRPLHHPAKHPSITVNPLFLTW